MVHRSLPVRHRHIPLRDTCRYNRSALRFPSHSGLPFRQPHRMVGFTFLFFYITLGSQNFYLPCSCFSCKERNPVISSPALISTHTVQPAGIVMVPFLCSTSFQTSRIEASASYFPWTPENSAGIFSYTESDAGTDFPEKLLLAPRTHYILLPFPICCHRKCCISIPPFRRLRCAPPESGAVQKRIL